MKMKSTFLLSILFVLCSCGSSRSTGKDRITVSSINRIVAASGIDIYFSHSTSNYVEIESGGNVGIEVKGGSLILHRKGKGSSNRGKSAVYVYGNNIESIILSGGSSFSSNEVKTDKYFSVAASGGSSVRIDKLDADNCSLAFSGNTSCDVKQLKSKNLNIATSGNSNANINIAKADKTNLASSGASRITARGKAQDVSVSSSRGSGINITDLKYENLNTHQSQRGSIRK